MKKVIISAALTIFCFAAMAANDSTKVKQCKGITAKGQPCKSAFIKKGAEYCNVHSIGNKCAGKNSNGFPCGNKVNEKGEFCRFHNK